MGLKLGAPVEVYVLLRKQFNGHVVDGLYLLLEHNGFKKRIHTVVTLHESMLCDEERDASLTQAYGILAHHVVLQHDGVFQSSF